MIMRRVSPAAMVTGVSVDGAAEPPFLRAECCREGGETAAVVEKVTEALVAEVFVTNAS